MLEKKLIALTKELIKFQTVSNNLPEHQKAISFIKNYCQGVFKREYLNNSFPSLLLRNIKDEDLNFDIILHGHLDVAPVRDKKDFIPKVVGDKLYGRGSLDMKGGLAVIIELLIYFTLKKINKKIAVLITTDEEIGGDNGTKYLINKIGIRGKFFITAEGEKKWLIKNEQKGVLMLRFTSHTKGGHSAYTWNTKNAISVLFSFLQQLKLLFPEDKKDKNHWYTTMNIGVFKGGLATNSVPSEAVAQVDIRYCNNWTDSKEIINKISHILKKNKNIKMEIIYESPMMLTNPQNLYVKKLIKFSKKVLQLRDILLYRNPGTNDARFAAFVGIPSVAFGPIGDNYHTENEYVSIKSLVSYYHILNNFIINFS